MYLVDTDWVIDVLSGRKAARAQLSQLAAQGIATSIVSYAEVYEGVYHNRDPESASIAFDTLMSGVTVLGISEAVARRFGTIRGGLRAQGLLIPAPDLFIAATALEHGLQLVTRNVRHFDRISGLNLYGAEAG